MKKILIRVDGNHQLGMGDVSSMINLAEELKGFEILFVSKYIEGINKIEEFGYKIERIAEDISYEDEIRFIKELVKDLKLSVVVVELIIDNYGDYIEEISKISKTVVFDFFGNLNIYSDVLINWMGLNGNYKYNFLKEGAEYYSGLDYIPLNKRIKEYNLLNKRIPSETSNILITFGGSDLRNFTLRVIKVLEKFKGINITIVIGSVYKHKEKLQKFLRNLKCEYDLKENVSNLSEIMFNSDLAISTGGLTAFELCAVGTPFISIAAVGHQVDRLKKMDELGVCKYAGDWEDLKDENLYSIINELIENKKEREFMSERGKKLIDGRGTERLSNIIKNLAENQNKSI